MQIFLINLDRRPDRLEQVKTQLDQLGLEFQRISAVDGSQLPADYPLLQKERFLLEQKKPAVIGEIGCAESHRLIWKQMIAQQLAFALVLEDDITLNPKLTEFLSTKAYEAYDFVNLSSAEPYPLDSSALHSLLQQRILERPLLWQSTRQLWRKLEWRRRWRIFKLNPVNKAMVLCECDPAPALGSGYILSLAAAESFLAQSNKLFFPIDLVWRYSPGLLRQAFLSQPLIEQTRGDSDIPGRYQGYRLTPWQSVKRFFVKSRRWQRRWDVARLYKLKIL
ncbi:MAG: glycosyltransferase family 25 protein [Thiothrix sp.]|nr:MAG: glycosyltransferase family 25 protein [Thiothrix sp.]